MRKIRQVTNSSRPSGLPLRADPPGWWIGETAIRVADIPKHVPAQADGRQIGVATAWRWTLRGVGGIAIRRFRVGGSWCTTLQEIARWQQALTAAAQQP